MSSNQPNSRRPRHPPSSLKTPCSLCKREKNSFEVIASFGTLSLNAQIIVKRTHSVNPGDLICNACRVKFLKKAKNENYTPKKTKKRKRLSCMVPDCLEMSAHDLGLTPETSQQISSYYNLDASLTDQAPLCNKHYQNFANAKRKDQCDVCKGILISRKYKVKGENLETFNKILLDDNLGVVLEINCILCSACYRHLTHSNALKLNKIDDTIEIRDATPTNIHERAAMMSARYLLSKFKEKRAVLLSDLYDDYLEHVETDCQKHKTDDDKFRKS